MVSQPCARTSYPLWRIPLGFNSEAQERFLRGEIVFVWNRHPGGEVNVDHGVTPPARYGGGKIYALAVITSLGSVGTLLAMGFDPGNPPMQILFLLPITLCAFFGGIWPGLLATALVVFVMSRDFAGRRRAEQALQEAHHHLGDRGLERTAKLDRSNESLRQGEARLAAVIDAMDAIISADDSQLITLFKDAAERLFVTEILAKPYSKD